MNINERNIKIWSTIGSRATFGIAALELAKKMDDLMVILTGGDANKLPKTLKNSIFAHSNFLAEGMFHLLKLNIDS